MPGRGLPNTCKRYDTLLRTYQLNNKIIGFAFSQYALHRKALSNGGSFMIKPKTGITMQQWNVTITSRVQG